ncbi:hypothetical protein [Paenalkalicoccus suaedae]|nr:hypothetical protein [Paenalkalicoccus suaedae]
MIRLSPSVALVGLVVIYGMHIFHSLPTEHYFLTIFMSSNACLLLIEKGVEVRERMLKKQINSHYLEQLKKQA